MEKDIELIYLHFMKCFDDDKLVDFCALIQTRKECGDGNDWWVIKHCHKSCTNCTGKIDRGEKGAFLFQNSS